MGKQSQLLLKPTEVELGLQVGVEFDNIKVITYNDYVCVTLPYFSIAKLIFNFHSDLS